LFRIEFTWGLTRFAHRAAPAGDAHQEIAEAVVEFFDVSHDSHRRMLRAARRG
jgi:hypothetical protein